MKKVMRFRSFTIGINEHIYTLRVKWLRFTFRDPGYLQGEGSGARAVGRLPELGVCYSLPSCAAGAGKIVAVE